jgi:glycosyltransferase involved in cell wall biosynthesis
LAIKIFHRLINQNSLSPTTKFFIIGRAGWKNQAIFDLVKRLKLEDKVIFLGYVADEDLPYFYSNALATFYLSQYEGFGLPPVESAKCETPVLLYQNSSLGEIFNEKYPYAKKGEEEKTLIYLLKNKINPKKFLTAEFSWDNAAKKFLAVIENIKKND